MKTLVLGSNGTLGKALVARLRDFGAGDVTGLARNECDITDIDQIERVVRAARPNVVYNAAAYTNVDAAEDEVDASYRANAIGPEALARACFRVGAKLLHYSTDFVFDGELERPYDEFDAPSPQGAYARSKLAGERLVLAACPHTFIVRVGCLYGQGGKNFPSTILNRIKGGQTIKADSTRVGSPTWVVPVVRASAGLAQTEHFGLYHCTANGETTWADYARFIADALGLLNADIQSVPYGALSLKAPRPRRSVLDNRMLRLRGLDTLGQWQEQALAFIDSENKQKT